MTDFIFFQELATYAHYFFHISPQLTPVFRFPNPAVPSNPRRLPSLRKFETSYRTLLLSPRPDQLLRMMGLLIRARKLDAAVTVPFRGLSAAAAVPL